MARTWVVWAALVVASTVIWPSGATPVRTSTCPSMCVCRQAAKRADCRDIPEWELKMSAAQVVRILPPAHHLAPGPLFLSRLDSFPKVQMLSVTNRSIVELIPGTLPFLQVLDLSHNKLARFSERTFHHMPALRKLTLEGNPIALKERIPLITSSSIRTLDLSQCGLSHIPNGSLDGMPLLTSLYLQGNPLKLENGVALVNKPSIQELDLSSCKLTQIPAGSLGNLVNLRRLFLRGNDLKTLSIGEMPLSVHVLDVSANRIRDAPLSALSAMQNLTTLELANNPLRCTCDFINFLDRLSERNVIFEKMIMCAEPQKYAKVFWKDINESDLCKDDIPSEESNETSSDSGGTSTASFSIEKEESSYEADMHPDEENAIVNQHAPPFLLNHLLQKASRLQNMEENSIQGDQPHSNTRDEKSDYMNDAPATTAENELHSEETTENLKDDLFLVESTETQDQSAREAIKKEEDDDSLILAAADDAASIETNKDGQLLEDFEKGPDASAGANNVSKPEDSSEDSTENPAAETFMRNAETIAMGKMMPHIQETATLNETGQVTIEQPILLESRTQEEALPETGNSHSQEEGKSQHDIAPINQADSENSGTQDTSTTDNAQTTQAETEKGESQSVHSSSEGDASNISQTNSNEGSTFETVTSQVSSQGEVTEGIPHNDLKVVEEATEKKDTSQATDDEATKGSEVQTTPATAKPPNELDHGNNQLEGGPEESQNLHDHASSQHEEGPEESQNLRNHGSSQPEEADESQNLHDRESKQLEEEAEDSWVAPEHESIRPEIESNEPENKSDHESIEVEVEATTKESVAVVPMSSESAESALGIVQSHDSLEVEATTKESVAVVPSESAENALGIVESHDSEPTTQVPFPEVTVHHHHQSSEREIVDEASTEEDNDEVTSDHKKEDEAKSEEPTEAPAQVPSSTETVTIAAAVETAPVDDKENQASEAASGEVATVSDSQVSTPRSPTPATDKPHSAEEGFKLFGINLIPTKDKAVSVIDSEQTSSEELSGESNMPRVSGTDVTPVDAPGQGEVKTTTIAYALLGVVLVCIIVAVACVSFRTRSDNKRNGAAPVRIRGDNISPGTEMKDMMNPLLEPITEGQPSNQFHDEPPNSIQVNGQNGKLPVISPVEKEMRNMNGDGEGHLANNEPQNGTPCQADSLPASANRNGKPPRQSKVKIKEALIPPPKTPVFIKTINGQS